MSPATIDTVKAGRTHFWRSDMQNGPPREQSGRVVILTGDMRQSEDCESGVMVETVKYGWWDLHWFEVENVPSEWGNRHENPERWMAMGG